MGDRDIRHLNSFARLQEYFGIFSDLSPWRESIVRLLEPSTAKGGGRAEGQLRRVRKKEHRFCLIQRNPEFKSAGFYLFLVM